MITDIKTYWSSGILYLVLLSTIGPNLFFRLRMEHLVIYPILLILIMIKCTKGTLMIPKVYWLPTLLFISCLFCVIGDLYISPATRMASYMTSLGRLLEPPVLFIVIYRLLQNDISGAQFKKGCFFILIIACIATAFTFISIMKPDNFLSRFYSLGEGSVGQASYDVKRFLGFFNQPLEAGIFFSVALFCLYYLRQIKEIGRVLEGISFCVISAGGLMTLSKNFYLLGFGCVAIYLLISDRHIHWYYFMMMFVMISIGFITVWKFNETYIQSYIDLYEKFGLFTALSAGRFSESNSVPILFENVLRNGIFTGLGIGTFMPLDNGYLEYFYHGGLFALICYVMFVGMFVFACFYHRGSRNLRSLQFSLGIFIIIASFGGPVLTANRACIVLMYLIAGSYSLSYRSIRFSYK